MDAMIKHRRQLIKDGLHALASTVTLLYYTPDVASASTRAERELLEDVASASDRIQLSVLPERWDATREREVGIARTPAIVVRGATDPGIRYYGATDGYELETFLAVIRAVADGCSGLSQASRAQVGELADARHLEVLVAPT
jgi:hypothetical protein